MLPPLVIVVLIVPLYLYDNGVICVEFMVWGINVLIMMLLFSGNSLVSRFLLGLFQEINILFLYSLSVFYFIILWGTEQWNNTNKLGVNTLQEFFVGHCMYFYLSQISRLCIISLEHRGGEYQTGYGLYDAIFNYCQKEHSCFWVIHQQWSRNNFYCKFFHF